MKAARNILSGVVYDQLVSLCDDQLGSLDVERYYAQKAVLCSQIIEALTQGKKRIIIDVDYSKNGWGA